jgi:hypothetical protein
MIDLVGIVNRRTQKAEFKSQFLPANNASSISANNGNASLHENVCIVRIGQLQHPTNIVAVQTKIKE